MDDIAVPSTYNEPTLMWRMCRGEGRQAQAVIDPRGASVRVVWFVNGRPLGLRDFTDWGSAIKWSDQLKSQYRVVGWRPLDDVDRSSPRAS